MALGAALFAAPVDEARAHNDSRATLHAEQYPLHQAAEMGDLDSVNHFLNIHMVDVNAKEIIMPYFGETTVPWGGETPLHPAAHRGHALVASVLLAAGAEVNAKRNDGYTPLHLADGKVSVAIILLAAGADVNAKDNAGNTPLHWGIGYASAVSLLLAAGADVNAKNNMGRTPLHWAAYNHAHASAISLLLAAGADVNAKDNNGYTPLRYSRSSSYCSFSRRAAVCSALIAAGGHWGEACAGAATVNPARPNPPCLCESPNFRTADNCQAPPSAQVCGELTPPKFYNATAGECVPLATCQYEELLNTETNTCEASADACGKLTPPKFYDAAAERCVPLATCGHERVRNTETNICECLAPNVRVSDGNCLAPSAANCGKTWPPFYSPTLSACVPYSECLAAGDCALSANACAHGFINPSRFYDSTAGECVEFLECDSSTNLNRRRNKCECTVSHWARYLRTSGVCESSCARPETAISKGSRSYPYGQRNRTFSYYECECSVDTVTDVNGTCELLYPCHASAVRKADNSGCECPPERPFSHGDPSGGEHRSQSSDRYGLNPLIPQTAICHPADHDPLSHDDTVDNSAMSRAIRDDNAIFIAHYIKDHKQNVDGDYHLHTAAQHNSQLAAIALIESGANVNRLSSNGTPLHLAARHSSFQVAEILIDRGADLNLQDYKGETPLHEAARLSDSPSNVRMVSLLLEKGADPNMRNNNGWRALDLAYHGGNAPNFQARRNIMAALVSGGADWSDQCTGGKKPNPHYRPSSGTRDCVCPSHVSHDNNGVCECPAQTHSQVNGLCLEKDSAQISIEILKMQAELESLRAALVSLNARLSLALESPETSRTALENAAAQAENATREIARRRANFMALSRADLAGPPPPPVALSDTETTCRALNGRALIHAATGTRICAGVDRAGTFCLVGSREAFPCRGLFRHVRACNLDHNRPAENPFLCAPKCQGEKRAIGAGCADL